MTKTLTQKILGITINTENKIVTSKEYPVLGWLFFEFLIKNHLARKGYQIKYENEMSRY